MLNRGEGAATRRVWHASAPSSPSFSGNRGGFMRFRKTSVAAACAVAAGVISAGLPMAVASADASPPLDDGGFSRVVVDTAHHHIYFSAGTDTGTVEVTDLTGAKVGEITGEPGAEGMALSPDGGTLYVALSQGGAVSAVDTTTLQETARYNTGAGTQPESVVAAGGKVWFSYTGGANGTDGGLGSVDLGGSTPSVTLGDPTWYGAPLLVGDPADPDTVVAADDWEHPATLAVYDVSSGSAVRTAVASRAVDNEVRDMQVTPDGKDLVVAASADNAVQRFRMSDLSADGTYPAGWGPTAVAIAPDGTVAVGGDGYPFPPGVSVFGAGESTPRRNFATGVAPAGLAWSPDGSTLYAVGGGNSPVVQVYSDPEQGDNALSLTPPGSAVPGAQYTVGGTMKSVEPFADGTTVQVTRTDAADPDGTELPDAAVGPDGTFSFTDTETATGDVSYQVSYAGDPLHLAAQGSASLTVAKADSALSLNAPATAPFGKPLTLTGTLTSPVAFAAGQTVRIEVANAQHTVSAGTAAVAANGTYAFTTTPYVGGPVTYTATYAGDAQHTGGSGTAPVAVSRTAASVSVTTNASTYSYGAKAAVTAHLGTTYNGRTVSVYATPYGGTKTLVRTGTVDSHGNLAATYAVTRATTFSVSYAGDYRYAPASASHAVQAYAKVTDGLRGAYTTAKVGATTYAVYHHTVDPVQSAVVSPAKTGECVAFTAQEWYGGAWRTIASAGCMRTDPTSTALAQLTGSHPVGPHFRFRTEYVHAAGDPANLSTYGAWIPFMFRN